MAVLLKASLVVVILLANVAIHFWRWRLFTPSACPNYQYALEGVHPYRSDTGRGLYDR